MANGIIEYIDEHEMKSCRLIGTDIKDRGYAHPQWNLTYDLDFLHDDYPFERADNIIMNPPYSTLEPFLIRALEIAKHKLIVLCRTQALEGKDRFEKIFINNPPTDVYQYVDRIQCWRNGVPPTGSSAQAYCWLVWDKDKENKETILHWIRRK